MLPAPHSMVPCQQGQPLNAFESFTFAHAFVGESLHNVYRDSDTHIQAPQVPKCFHRCESSAANTACLIRPDPVHCECAAVKTDIQDSLVICTIIPSDVKPLLKVGAARGRICRPTMLQVSQATEHPSQQTTGACDAASPTCPPEKIQGPH